MNLEVLRDELGVQACRPEEVAICHKGIVYSDMHFLDFPSGAKIRWGHYLAPWRSTPYRVLGLLAHFLFISLLRHGPTRAFSWLRLRLVCVLLGPSAERIQGGWRGHVERCRKKIHELNQDLAQLNRPTVDLLQRQFQRIDDLTLEFLRHDLPIYVIKEALFKALNSLWTRAGLQQDDLVRVLSHGMENVTLHMGRELESLAVALRLDPQSDVFLRQLEACSNLSGALLAANVLGGEGRHKWIQFVQEYAHNTTSWDLRVPTWEERPQCLAPVLRNLLSAEAPSPQGEELGGQEYLFLALGLGAGEMGWFRAALTRVRTFMAIDEEQHFLSGMLIGPSRRLIRLAHQELRQRGVVDEEDLMYFMSLEEMRQALVSAKRNLSPLLRARRQRFLGRSKLVPEFELPPRLGFTMDSEGAWQGQGVAPGQVEGECFVCESLDRLPAVPQGAILVTASPNPALTPLFPRLGGIISASGGPLAHGFVSAREYGLPCVSGMTHALEQLKTGDHVRVDGVRGTVEVIMRHEHA